MSTPKRETRLEETTPQQIYYFGYGPIVNEMVRKRRGIETTEIQAAYVPDYRLTFAFGGNANIVAKVGYEVHGLLMKLKSRKDWEKLKAFEAGHIPSIRTVVPYSAKDDNADDAEEGPHNADQDFCVKAPMSGAVQAYMIVNADNVDDTLLDAPIERLPQERYLKLIADGMRQYGVDEDYITDHIEACPFIPNRSRADYYEFPICHKKKVPVISQSRYEQLCARAKVEGDLYFVLGTRVFRMGEHDPANPLAKWFETHGHGKPDCTYMTHLTVVDPEIPLIYSAKDVTPLHTAWAENHLVEVVEQYGMSATRVYELAGPGMPIKDEEMSEESSSEVSVSNVRVRRKSRRKSFLKWLSCPLTMKKRLDDGSQQSQQQQQQQRRLSLEEQ